MVMSRFGSAMTGHVQKHDEQQGGAILMLSDWSYKLVASTASGLKVKQSLMPPNAFLI